MNPSEAFRKFPGNLDAVNSIVTASFPNKPNWEHFEPDYSEYTRSIGRSIIANNEAKMRELGLEIDENDAPQVVKDMLGLTIPEVARIFENEQIELSALEIRQRFLAAKFIKDFLEKRLREGVLSRIIRINSLAYGDRNMLEMIGDGEGDTLVGMTYDSFDLYSGS